MIQAPSLVTSLRDIRGFSHPCPSHDGAAQQDTADAGVTAAIAASPILRMIEARRHSAVGLFLFQRLSGWSHATKQTGRIALEAQVKFLAWKENHGWTA